jgi:hypothetical protein
MLNIFVDDWQCSAITKLKKTLALIRQMTTIILLTHVFDWNSQRKSKHGSKIK